MLDPITTVRRRRSKFYGSLEMDMVQLTVDNSLTVEKWVKEHGGDATEWTNESFVVGIWLSGTWHDRGSRTPVPFGWWVYVDEDGDLGCAAEISIDEHYEDI